MEALEFTHKEVTIKIPEILYERARETAEATSLSLDEVFAQSIALSLPPLEEELSGEIRSMLSSLALLSDDELENIAHGQMYVPDQESLESLAETQKRRPLTSKEQVELNGLMIEVQKFMLRKAEAYRLLARRGYSIY